ncbi:cell division protein FtsA [Candidatus Roizmanbacteria bacterium RIFCSPHIGHO2_02_FULL_37_13b]|uniref:Cell division protein FtsA n=1 Tax=Candidatus Roizmanbacteria bacterium RIFCSPLOWO2_02_FULL_36_11 TaxID=1802071 RepID=A0A1F7JG55_9BACT|nr:MAG: cell division protein FtsA [Candidatus Roizmanbacteria bacterium RIFCSPHIGHO2_02_FULL_37_13b]OGK54593.1 MAG: cell division protein FtsA [Candidatus Roizmanbacteria bacterium RIFCSPLOWO2_02_FULL_36_11]
MAEQIITGIDIGTSKIVSIIASVAGEDRTPRIMGFATVDSKGVRKGQIVDIAHVSSALEDCIEKAERMAGIKVNSAYVTVGGPHISSINSHGVVAVSQPDADINASDIERAIEAAKAISLSSTREVIEVIPREYIVDGQSGIKNPIGMSGVRLEVNTHIITASVTNLKNIERCLTDLGIAVDGFVFSGLSSSLAVVSETEKELGVVLIDIGGGKTDICIFVDGALSYSSSIPIGARHITNDIAVGLRISLESSEKIKLFLMDKKNLKKKLDKDNLSKKDDIDVSDLNLLEGLSTVSYKTVIDGIMKPRLEEIYEKVFSEIEKSELSNQVPSGLVIVGGGASTVSSVEVAKHIIGMSARVGTPQHVTGLIDEIMYPQYSAVVGLLLYAKDYVEEKAKLNIKDFNSILRSFSVKGSVKKVIGIFKSYIP